MERKWVFGLLLSVLTILLPVGMLPAAEQRFDVPLGASQQRGPANAPVTLIEFLDFQ